MRLRYAQIVLCLLSQINIVYSRPCVFIYVFSFLLGKEVQIKEKSDALSDGQNIKYVSLISLVNVIYFCIKLFLRPTKKSSGKSAICFA